MELTYTGFELLFLAGACDRAVCCYRGVDGV